ncbi:MAG: trimethylamine methyltransferase family protein [Rhodospirillales bacterium]
MSRREGGRRGTRARRDQSAAQSMGWQNLTNSFPRWKVLRDEELEAIHNASLKLLEEQGLEVLSSEAVERYAKAGALVDRETGLVRLGRDLVMDLVGKAPSSFTLTPRNPAHAQTFGGDHFNIGCTSGPPNCSDLEGGRRPGTYADACDLIKLFCALGVGHNLSASPVEAMDLPAETRHMDCYYANLTLSDRVFMARAIGSKRVEDALDMIAIARGLDREALKEDPSLMAVISVNSPRRVDAEMIAGLTALAENGQAAVVTPFTLMGAMTPVTLAGALMQQNAEALAVIAYTQLVRPGAPVIYGGFTSNVDMKSGAPAFGTPEYSYAVIAGGQLARRYNLPYRSSNVNASNAVDAQSAYEAQNSLWACMLGGVNLVHQGMGWLEGGLVTSYEQMVVDAELIRMVAHFLSHRPKVDEETLALDAIREVGPGGHFFGVGHTIERYETAFYQPLLSDWRNFESWQEAGAENATQRASKIAKQLIADYEPPPLDPALDQELQAFMANRKAEGPAGLAA